jgi:SPP1 family predicted phage head-tail adaptor
MIAAGRLCKRISLYSVTPSHDSTVGDLELSEAAYAQRWAEIKPLSSDESEIAAGQQARTMASVTIRHTPQLRHTDRIVWNDDSWEVMQIMPDCCEGETRFVMARIEAD